MLRIPHCLDSRLTDGGKVVNPTHPPHSSPRKQYYFSVSGTHFCYRLSKLQGLVRPKGLGKFKNSPHRAGTFRLVAERLYVIIFHRIKSHTSNSEASKHSRYVLIYAAAKYPSLFCMFCTKINLKFQKSYILNGARATVIRKYCSTVNVLAL
jgi:hypothetical protein